MRRKQMSCKFGFTPDEVKELLFQKFSKWMDGQTTTTCNAWAYDHETGSYKPSGCKISHGVVYYPWDVNRYIAGLEIND